jgi:hypothetical protein
MAVIAQNCPNIRVCVVDISVSQIQVGALRACSYIYRSNEYMMVFFFFI